jgi:glycosyltransferase involved in cell wall biosynthesis
VALSGNHLRMKKFDRSIKVANIIEEGRVGGPQKRILMVASKISDKIDTTIIFPKKNSSDFQSLCKKLNVKYLKSSLITIKRNIFSVISYLILFPYEVLKLSHLLKKNQFDLIHISGGSWQYKGILAAKLANIKAVWHLNDTYVPLPFRIIFKILSPLASGYIFSAHRAKEYYDKYLDSEKPKFIIPPPVDTTLFSPSQNFTDNKEIIESLRELIVIGTIANINKIKGLETFIRAGSFLNKNFKNLHFIIIGEVFANQRKYFNSLRELCEKMNLSNIDFVNNCSDVRPLLQRFDIFTITSLSETGPMTLWEAMSMEKAIVSTDVGDVRKFVKNDINGYIININDPDNLAKKITKLIICPEIRKNFGKKVRQVVKSKLDLKICADLHTQAYQVLANND